MENSWWCTLKNPILSYNIAKYYLCYSVCGFFKNFKYLIISQVNWLIYSFDLMLIPFCCLSFRWQSLINLRRLVNVNKLCTHHVNLKRLTHYIFGPNLLFCTEKSINFSFEIWILAIPAFRIFIEYKDWRSFQFKINIV